MLWSVDIHMGFSKVLDDFFSRFTWVLVKYWMVLLRFTWASINSGGFLCGHVGSYCFMACEYLFGFQDITGRCFSYEVAGLCCFRLILTKQDMLRPFQLGIHIFFDS